MTVWWGVLRRYIYLLIWARTNRNKISYPNFCLFDILGTELFIGDK